MGRGRPRKYPDEVPLPKPAPTPEGREQQLVAAAWNLAERQIHEGTASAQVITTFLKLGTSRELLEQERLRHENELLVAKREAMAQVGRIEELYVGAIAAMRSYQGHPSDEPMGEVDDYED